VVRGGCLDLERGCTLADVRSYKGQRHYLGSFWSATERDLVLYESRLELARLLFADFERSGPGIVAQPFLLEAEIDGRCRRHVLDFLLLTESLPVVVDVKPASRVSNPDVAFVLAWTRRSVEGRGWVYEVWSEPPAVELANVRMLAGYRREWLFDPTVLAELREVDLDGMPLGAVSLALPHRPPETWPLPRCTCCGSSTLCRSRAPAERDDRAAGRSMTGGAVRIGVGTRFQYDGEMVAVIELVITQAGSEVVLQNAGGSLTARIALRELRTSDHVTFLPDAVGAADDELADPATVVLAELSEAELRQVRERAAHVREVLTGYRAGSAELAAAGEPQPVPLESRRRW
jgi:hypothetical protein